MIYTDKIEEAFKYIKSILIDSTPKIALVMGTGLSSIVEEMIITQEIPYSDIPHFPISTVKSHTGKIIIGKINDIDIIIYSGRWHYYEGYSSKELTLPIRVLKLLGIKTLLLTNVSGGVNPHFNAGDLVLITDHINMIPDHPLRGPNIETHGVQFPDFKQAYDLTIMEKIIIASKEKDYNLKKGVYYALQGPSLETPAEYKMIHRLGGDMVGMSTVPEVIVAHHSGIKVGAVSIISNECYPSSRQVETTIEEVIDIAQRSSKKLNEIISSLLPLI